VNREAQAAVLFLVGGAMVRAGSTDLLLRYVKPGSRPLLLGAGAVLMITGIVTIWYEWYGFRRLAAQGVQPESADDGHGHGHHEPRISWLLILPLLALILVAPPALGSFSASRTGTALQPPAIGFPTLPGGNPLQLGVSDYADRAVYDHGRSLADRQVELTGFITPGPSGTVYLTRMVLNCCAADALPIKIALTGKVPPIVQPDTWLTVVGTYTSRQTKDPINNGAVPYINISRATSVPTPSDPYDS
jgi:putative membrane protein